MVAKGSVQEGKNGPTQSAGCRKGQSLTIIFKGTNACNAGCRFCSAAGHKGDQITAEDFEILAGRIEEYIADAGMERLSFTFHGGEPTLLGAVASANQRFRTGHVEEPSAKRRSR